MILVGAFSAGSEVISCPSTLAWMACEHAIAHLVVILLGVELVGGGLLDKLLGQLELGVLDRRLGDRHLGGAS